MFLFTASSIHMDGSHWHTGARKEPKCITVHKVRHVEGWTDLTGIWKPPLKIQSRESLSCFVVLGMKMLRIFHRCSAGSRIDLGSSSGNASSSAESCGNDLHCTERGHSPERVFHQEQTAAWRVGNAGSVPLLILHLNVELPQSCHVSLFIVLLLGIFWSSCYMWLFMVNLWEAAICLLWYPHNYTNSFYTNSTNSPLVLFGFFYLFDWFVWVCLFGFLSVLVWGFYFLFYKLLIKLA